MPEGDFLYPPWCSSKDSSFINSDFTTTSAANCSINSSPASSRAKVPNGGGMTEKQRVAALREKNGGRKQEEGLIRWATSTCSLLRKKYEEAQRSPEPPKLHDQSLLASRDSNIDEASIGVVRIQDDEGSSYDYLFGRYNVYADTRRKGGKGQQQQEKAEERILSSVFEAPKVSRRPQGGVLIVTDEESPCFSRDSCSFFSDNLQQPIQSCLRFKIHGPGLQQSSLDDHHGIFFLNTSPPKATVHVCRNYSAGVTGGHFKYMEAKEPPCSLY